MSGERIAAVARLLIDRKLRGRWRDGMRLRRKKKPEKKKSSVVGQSCRPQCGEERLDWIAISVLLADDRLWMGEAWPCIIACVGNCGEARELEASLNGRIGNSVNEDWIS
jgi:hypothetical protein